MKLFFAVFISYCFGRGIVLEQPNSATCGKSLVLRVEKKKTTTTTISINYIQWSYDSFASDLQNGDLINIEVWTKDQIVVLIRRKLGGKENDFWL